MPLLTEAPWSIASNKRSHRFFKKAMDKLLSTANFKQEGVTEKQFLRQKRHGI